MYILETQLKRVPWRWVVLTVLLGFSQLVAVMASGNFIFTIRKFVASPVLINSLTSLDVLFNLMVAAPCLCISDRIWTRWGRRKIFVLPAWLIMAFCLFVMPFASGAFSVVVVMLLWYVFQDVADTFQLLQMELIPPDQRRIMAVMASWMQNTFGFCWALVVVGRFDDAVWRPGFAFSGDRLIYWLGGASLLAGVVFLALFVKENRPNPSVVADCDESDAVPAPRFGGLFTSRQLWPVYLLVFSQVLLTTGLGSIDPLLVTVQWGYSKQDMGTNIFVGGVINILYIFALGFVVNRVSSLRLFVIGMTGLMAAKVSYYVFVQFVLPDRRPEIFHMILFGQIMSMFGQCSAVSALPLIFDYIPRDKMGAAQAGLNFVRSLTRLVTLNGIGLWVSIYSGWFCAPGVYDYFSGYLFVILLNFLGLAILVNFIMRVRSGELKPLGRERLT